jgi:sulfatase maturation enzyme AslB (radical SAM superfamily)
LTAKPLGFAPSASYQMLTQAGGLYVGNMVDTTYSLVASVAKEHLGRPRQRKGNVCPLRCSYCFCLRAPMER